MNYNLILYCKKIFMIFFRCKSCNNFWRILESVSWRSSCLSSVSLWPNKTLLYLSIGQRQVPGEKDLWSTSQQTRYVLMYKKKYFVFLYNEFCGAMFCQLVVCSNLSLYTGLLERAFCLALYWNERILFFFIELFLFKCI